MDTHFLQFRVKLKKVVGIHVLGENLVVGLLLRVSQAHAHEVLFFRRELLRNVALVPAQQNLFQLELEFGGLVDTVLDVFCRCILVLALLDLLGVFSVELLLIS